MEDSRARVGQSRGQGLEDPEVTAGEARLAEERVKPALRLRRECNPKGESEPRCSWMKDRSRKVGRYPSGQANGCPSQVETSCLGNLPAPSALRLLGH